jgi:hypothetical protein
MAENFAERSSILRFALSIEDVLNWIAEVKLEDMVGLVAAGDASPVAALSAVP